MLCNSVFLVYLVIRHVQTRTKNSKLNTQTRTTANPYQTVQLFAMIFLPHQEDQNFGKIFGAILKTPI